MLNSILSHQAVGAANLFISNIKSRTERWSHLKTMLAYLSAMDASAISPNFLMFVVNQLVSECLQEDADVYEMIAMTLHLCDILNGKTVIPSQSLMLPDNFFALFEKALSAPINEEQLVMLCSHMELFWRAERLSGLQYQEWMTRLLSLINLSRLKTPDILLILKNLGCLEQQFGFAKTIDSSFFAQIEVYLRSNSIDKKEFADIVKATGVLKAKKITPITVASSSITPARLAEKKPEFVQRLTHLGVWPERPFFEPEHRTYVSWRKTVVDAFNRVRQHPENAEIKQKAYGKVYAMGGEHHRQLVISFIYHSEINEIFFERLLFLLESGGNFLLHEPDSSSALYFATSMNCLILFKFFVERLHVKIINPPEKSVHPYFVSMQNMRRDKRGTPLCEYIIDNYKMLSNETFLITSIRYQDKILFDIILSREADRLDSLGADGLGVTPLMHALKHTTLDANYFIRKTLEYNCDVLIEDHAGRNAFAYALHYGQVNYFFDLLAQLNSISGPINLENIPLPNDNSPLFYAIKHGQERMVDALIVAGCSLDELDEHGLNLAHLCLQDNSLSHALRWVIAKNPKLISNEERTAEGDTVLLYAARHGYVWALDILLEAGADVHVSNRNGMTVGHYLVLNQQGDLLKQWLPQYNFNVLAKNSLSENLLDLAAKSFKNQEIFRVCLGYLRQKRLPLDLKNQVYFFAILEYLAALPEEGVHFIDEHGQTLLHLACLYGGDNQAIVKSLITTHHFSVNVLNKHKQTPLYVLVRQQLIERAVAFMDTYSPRLSNLDGKQSSLLHLICEMNELSLAERYMRRLTRYILLARNPDGKTPLDLAFQTKNTTLISMLWTHLTASQQATAFAQFKAHQQQDRIDYVLAQGYVDCSAPLMESPEILLNTPHYCTETDRDLKRQQALLRQEEMVFPSIEDVFATISVTRHIPTLRLIKRLQLKVEGEANPYFEMLSEHVIPILDCAFQTRHYGVMSQVLRFPCVDKDMLMDAEHARRLLSIALSSGRGSVVRLACKLNALSDLASEHNNQALLDAVVNNRYEVVQALLQLKGVNESILQVSFVAACRGGQLDLIDLFLAILKVSQHAHESDALMIAIETNHFDLVCKLLALPNVRASVTMDCLLQAIRQNNIDLFMVFLSLEHIKPLFLIELTTGQCSPLALALELACDEIISHLLSLSEVEQFVRNHSVYHDLSPAVSNGSMKQYSEPVWFMEPLFLVPLTPLYPALNHLDDIYEASRSGRLSELKYWLGDYVFPIFFVQELYDILYLAVCSRQSHVVDYLLENETIAQYTLERINQLSARAIVNHDSTMLRTLMKYEVIRQHLTDNYNYPLRCAARYDAVALAKILLEDQAVNEKASALNNKALRTAAERGSLDMVQLLCSLESVRRHIHVFQNAPFRRAFSNGHTAVCLYLLMDPIVFQFVTQKESKYRALLLSFVALRLQPLPDSLVLEHHSRVYALIACYCLRYTGQSFSTDILNLLQYSALKSRAHLGQTSSQARNELLTLARAHGHDEVVDYLMSLPQVKKMDEQSSSHASSAVSLKSSYPKRFFAKLDDATSARECDATNQMCRSVSIDDFV